MPNNKGSTVNYNPELHPKQAMMLTQRGAVDREIAEFFDIPCSTFYNWRNTHIEFCVALQDGKEIADDRVERSLYNRAVGYSYDAVKIMSVAQGNNGGSEVVEVPYVEHVPPDIKAATRWLESRRPDRWRRSLALTGPKGGAVELTQAEQDFSGLDENERDQLRQLLLKQSAPPARDEGAQ